MTADTAPLVFNFDAEYKKLFASLSRLESKVVADLKRMNGGFERENAKVVRGLAQSAEGMSRFGNISGAQRFVIGNTANQFGDLAVQIAAGTPPLKAMGQQIPQILGGFGALGGSLGLIAPLLGTIAAIGLPLAAVFFNMASGSKEASEEADTLAKKLDLLKKSTSDYKDAAKEASITVADLRSEYADLAPELRQALLIQAELTRLSSDSARGDVAGRIKSDFFGDVPGIASVEAINAAIAGYDALIAKRDELFQLRQGIPDQETRLANEGRDEVQAQIETLDRVKGSLEQLAVQYGITAGQAAVLSSAFLQLDQAQGPEAQAQAAGRLAAQLTDVFGSVEAVETKFAGVLSALNGIVQQATQAKQAAQDLAITTSGVRDAAAAAADAMSGIGDAAAGALGTVQSLAASIWGAIGAMAQAREANRKLESDNLAAQYTLYGQGRQAAETAVAPFRLGVPASAPRRGGGGGGGGGTLNAQETADLARAKSLYEQTRTAAEKYATELEEINRLHAAGKIDADTAARAIGDLAEKYGEGIFKMSEFRDAAKSAFVGIITGADSAREAVSQLLARLAEMAASSAFDSIFDKMQGNGKGGGFLNSIFGAIFGGGKAPSFAGGGYTGFGARTGGLDGKGGFLAMVHPRESIIDHTRGGGRGGGSNITIDVRGAQGNSEIRAMVAEGVKAGIRANNRQVIPRLAREAIKDNRRVS